MALAKGSAHRAVMAVKRTNIRLALPCELF